ncbi:MAG: sulfotransferase [Ornithinimicrobium sp.]
MTPEPTFLVIGAARSGTTALVEDLRNHPRVFVTQPKEPHYFALHDRPPGFTGPGDASTINRVATPSLAAYRALYPNRGAGYDALGEGSVSTLYYHQHAIPEIRRLVPRAKLIIILREPVDRAKSAYDYLTSKGHETAPSLLDAVALETERIERGYHHLWHYTAMSRYAQSVGAFLATFGPEQVGIWFHDELVNDYDGTMSSVREFIGVRESEETASGSRTPRVNASGTPRSPTLTRAVRSAAGNRVSRHTIRAVTTFSFRERVRRMMVTSSALDTDTRELLAPRFAEDLMELRELLRDRWAPHWLTNPKA